MRDLDPAWLEFDPTGYFLAFVALVLLISVARHRARRSAFRAAAARLGLLFQPKGHPDATPFFRFPLFSRASFSRLRNVVRGENLVLFDYSYSVSSGSQQKPTRQTVAAHRIDGDALPDFALRPEGLVSRVNELLGAEDIDFSDDPDFSRRYQLAAKDETEIRRRFHADLRRQLTLVKRWSVEGGASWVIFYRKGKLVKPSQLSDFVEGTRKLAAALV